MKLPSSVRKLAQRVTGTGASESISPQALEAAVAREDVLVLAIGGVDDRLPGEQRSATMANLADVCAGVPRERLIVTHCG